MRGQAKPGIHLFDPGGGTCPANTNDHRPVIGPEAETARKESRAWWGQPQLDGECGWEKVSVWKQAEKIPGSVEAWDGRMDGAGRAVSSKKLCEQEP